MPAQEALYQEIEQKISSIAVFSKFGRPLVKRLALMTTGMLASGSCVLSRIATELLDLGLTKCSDKEHICRRLRRTLSDEDLVASICYEPVLEDAIDWDRALSKGSRTVLVIDESTKKDQVHLFRVSLGYRGASIPLAWATWPQNQAMAPGSYREQVDQVLRRAAALLPKGARVIGLADRAYDNPPFVDQVAGLGWDYVVRVKAKGALRFRDRMGREWSLRKLVRQRISVPGKRWKARGWVYKDAGWREVSLVGMWAPGEDEPLVVLTNLPPKWEVLAWYGKRFWTEAGFRNDKRMGLQWESSQVPGAERQGRLLVAMAWASLVAFLIGDQEAEEKVKRLREPKMFQGRSVPKTPKPEHARESVFTMGMGAVHKWFYGTASDAIHWCLSHIESPTWNSEWYAQQSRQFMRKTVPP